MKKNSIKRVAIGVLTGFVLLASAVWLLSRILGNTVPNLYAGKPIPYWRAQLNGHDQGASNEAFAIVNSQVIPQLTDRMFHDTNDSRLRLFLVETLNELPGVQINYFEAGSRRSSAAVNLGELGPPAKSSVPALIQALKGKDTMVHESAVVALGKIHSDPEVVIPLLTGYLDDDSVNDEAALALAEYGSLAKAAVPKIVPLLQAPDKDARVAGEVALKKIDPEAYANATKAPQDAMTNVPSVGIKEGGTSEPK
jgi:hypothetical protein